MDGNKLRDLKLNNFIKYILQYRRGCRKITFKVACDTPFYVRRNLEIYFILCHSNGMHKYKKDVSLGRKVINSCCIFEIPVLYSLYKVLQYPI